MTIRQFEGLFKPRSVALIGAGSREGSVGQVVLKNLLSAGFAGDIYPVNPKYDELQGVKCYPDVAALPQAPELAVLCVASGLVPGIIGALGARGTRAAVVITAGFAELGTPEGKKLEADMLAAAKPYGLRIIGPNCVGLMVPPVGLNASFAHMAPAKGKLAFISQSGALCTAVLDTVAGRDIGFSHFVSLGNSADVDFGDMLDYLANDAETTAILLYIESVTDVRKFISAGRAAARNKPVVVIKSGRNAAGAKAAASHTGALVGADAVYDVAFARAGMLRVLEMEELFDAVETLARLAGRTDIKRPEGAGGLHILSNGGGPAVLATDALVSAGGKLAALDDKTLAVLNAVLPPTWSHNNPVDIIGDADGARYEAAMRALMAAPDASALLVMKCPTAVSDNMEAARAVLAAYDGQGAEKPMLLTCWLGEATAHEAREAFAQAGIASYETPEKAVRAYLYIEEYRRRQRMALEVATPAGEVGGDKAAVEAIIDAARAQGRQELYEHEAKAVLAAYGIPVVKTLFAADAQAAVAAAEGLGYPVAVKLVSQQASHKSDVGGVMLGLKDGGQVLQAVEKIIQNLKAAKPEADIAGFTVQPMVSTSGYELILGMSTDKQFGPVLMFGEGGVAVEVINDKALGLPPLTHRLAMEMIQATRVYKRLKGFRDRKPVDMEGLANVLVRLSALVSEVGAIAELDINPLIIKENNMIALDGRVKINDTKGAARLAVSGYPQGMEREISLNGGARFRIRPVKPEDGAALCQLMEKMTPDDLIQRFQGEYPILIPAQAARISQVDYDREIVLVVTGSEKANSHEIYAFIQFMMHPGASEAEFSLLVRSDMHGHGLGREMVAAMEEALCRYPHIGVLKGVGLKGNAPVRELLSGMGYGVAELPDGKRILFTKIVKR